MKRLFPDKIITPIWLTMVGAGLLTFAINFSFFHPLLFMVSIIYLVVSGYYICRKRLAIKILFPFAGGILVVILRLFYWDGVDFSNRLNALLGLILFISIYLLFRQQAWLERLVEAFSRLQLKRQALAVFLLMELIFLLTAGIMTGRGLKLVGDEPHYLLIAQSLVKDADLNVANQYGEKQYQDFLDTDSLGIHGYYGKKGQDYIYSMHLPGTALTTSPFMALKISPPLLYILLRAYLGLFASLLAVLIFLISLKMSADTRLSLRFSLIFSLTAPVFFHGLHIYPEIQVTLLITAAIYLLVFHKPLQPKTAALAGFLLSLTIFWGVKYATFMYLFVIGFFIYLLVIKKRKAAFILILFPLLLQGLFWLYLLSAYGNISPMSVYMNESQKSQFFDMVKNIITLKMRIESGLDYFFDQRDGLLLYNPFYFFVFPGLILALRKWKRYRFHLLLSIPAMLFVLSYAFLTHRGGMSPQARPLVAVAPFMLLFIFIYLRESQNIPAKRLLHLLPLYALFVTAYQIFHPFSIHQTTTSDNLHRAGMMFQLWGNTRINLPRLLPSYAKVPGNEVYLPNLVFLILFILLLFWSLYSQKRKSRLHWLWPAAILFLLLFVLFPRIPLYNPTTVDRVGSPQHHIFAVSPYPVKRQQRLFHISKPGKYSYTVATRRRMKGFRLNVVNPFDTPAEVGVSNMDVSVTEIVIPPGGDRSIDLSRVEQKQFRNYWITRLHFRVQPAGKKGSVNLNVEFFPVQR